MFEIYSGMKDGKKLEQEWILYFKTFESSFFSLEQETLSEHILKITSRINSVAMEVT